MMIGLPLILLFLGFGALMRSIQVNCNLFYVKNYKIMDQDSIIIKIKNSNKIICLRKCSIISDCGFAFFEENQCVLLKIIETYNLNVSCQGIMYLKQNESIKVNEFSYTSTEFWSLRTNSCLPCKPGFIMYSELPFFCYHYFDFSLLGGRNYNQSKEYCKSKNSYLFTPKTDIERIFFTKKIPYSRVYLDSIITSLGQIFKWKDGSDVEGFAAGEPNNARSSSLLIENCLQLRSDGFFNDVTCNLLLNLTICQHD